MSGLTCPKCQSTNIRRSHTRTLKETLFKIFGWRAYRCREKKCRWRGLIRTKTNIEIFLKVTDKVGAIIVYILVIVLLILILFLIFRILIWLDARLHRSKPIRIFILNINLSSEKPSRHMRVFLGARSLANIQLFFGISNGCWYVPHYNIGFQDQVSTTTP
jgi:hypothetical protein